MSEQAEPARRRRRYSSTNNVSQQGKNIPTQALASSQKQYPNEKVARRRCRFFRKPPVARQPLEALVLSEATLEQLGPRNNVLFLGALVPKTPMTTISLFPGHNLLFPGTLIPRSPPTTNSLFPAIPGDGKSYSSFGTCRPSLIPNNSPPQQIVNKLICCSWQPFFPGAPDSKFLIPGSSWRRRIIFELFAFPPCPFSRQFLATKN